MSLSNIPPIGNFTNTNYADINLDVSISEDVAGLQGLVSPQHKRQADLSPPPVEKKPKKPTVRRRLKYKYPFVLPDDCSVVDSGAVECPKTVDNKIKQPTSHGAVKMKDRRRRNKKALVINTSWFLDPEDDEVNMKPERDYVCV